MIVLFNDHCWTSKVTVPDQASDEIVSVVEDDKRSNLCDDEEIDCENLHALFCTPSGTVAKRLQTKEGVPTEQIAQRSMIARGKYGSSIVGRDGEVQ
jgi:hypothetical protein